MNLSQPPIFNQFSSLVRLRTGTPPRLNKHTIDYSKCIKQEVDEEYTAMHLGNRKLLKTQFNQNEQIECYLTQTTLKTKEIVLSHLDRLPDYKTEEGIEAKPPRYCPSIDAKIRRFQDKDQHYIWLEPESQLNNVLFPNGLSTGFPLDIQEKIVESITGLENAEILRPAYSVEYDCVNPKQLKPTLELEKISGLFLAGQINGTTGYEEAGSQGILAGINAGLHNTGENAQKLGDFGEFVLERDEAMIGVLVDDITSLGLREPYRIFTSRSEYRLSVRPDNSYERLSQKSEKIGVKNEPFFEEARQRRKSLDQIEARLNGIWVSKAQIIEAGLDRKVSEKDNKPKSLYELVQRFNFKKKECLLLAEDELSDLDLTFFEDCLIKVFYEVYSKKEASEAKSVLRDAKKTVIEGFDFGKLKGVISNEEVEILVENQPKTLFAASRLSGIRPMTLSYIKTLV